MKYYLAPMEGITGYVYRRAYHRYFHPMDKYFTPFLAPTQNKVFTSREKNDILPEHNEGMVTVPQILTNDAQLFQKMVENLQEYGYQEVNINLGCPSRTVVSKGRGSGFLAKTEQLDRFLDEVFSKNSIGISIKTRIGKDDPEEFEELMRIYNQYPLTELIIHPRVQKDYYANTPNLTVFKEALKQSKAPVCYNGDLFTTTDYENITKENKELSMVMCGRGILVNPGLINAIEKEPVEKGIYRKFHDMVYEDYKQVLSGEKNVLFKMKEFWLYQLHGFKNGTDYIKKIKKAQRIKEYEAFVQELFLEELEDETKIQFRTKA